MVYQPLPVPITLRTDSLSGRSIRLWSYSPATGKAVLLGEVQKAAELTLSPEGNEADRVFVLDDASRGFSPPGQGVFKE